MSVRRYRRWMEREFRRMTVIEFARARGVSYNTVLLWLKQGLIPGAIQRDGPGGKCWDIPREALRVERPRPGRKRARQEGKPMANTIEARCRWCETSNDITEARDNNQLAYCTACGHCVEGLPVDCDCRRCTETKRLIEIHGLERARGNNG